MIINNKTMIKFALTYIFYFIYVNKIKFIFFGIFITSLVFFLKDYNDVLNKSEIIHNFEYNNEFYYVKKDDENKIVKFPEEKEITNSTIEYYTISSYEIGAIALFVSNSIVLFFVLLISFVEKDFDTDVVFKKTFFYHLKSYMIKDKIDYTILGRYLKTIDKANHRKAELFFSTNIKSITDIRTLPLYTNQEIERKNKIKKILHKRYRFW